MPGRWTAVTLRMSRRRAPSTSEVVSTRSYPGLVNSLSLRAAKLSPLPKGSKMPKLKEGGKMSMKDIKEFRLNSGQNSPMFERCTSIWTAQPFPSGQSGGGCTIHGSPRYKKLRTVLTTVSVEEIQVTNILSRRRGRTAILPVMIPV